MLFKNSLMRLKCQRKYILQTLTTFMLLLGSEGIVCLLSFRLSEAKGEIYFRELRKLKD
jgi:hypothetical protein